MINLNKIVYGIIYVICLFVISMISGFADTAKAKEFPDIRTAERFNMGYPLKNITYGSENSFKNDGWIGFISSYGTGWRLMWDPRTGRPNLIEGKGIPFYAGKGNNLPGEIEELSIEYLHNKIMDFLKSNSTVMKIESASIELNKNASHIFDNGRYAVIQYD